MPSTFCAGRPRGEPGLPDDDQISRRRSPLATEKGMSSPETMCACFFTENCFSVATFQAESRGFGIYELRRRVSKFQVHEKSKARGRMNTQPSLRRPVRSVLQTPNRSRLSVPHTLPLWRAQPLSPSAPRLSRVAPWLRLRGPGFGRARDDNSSASVFTTAPNRGFLSLPGPAPGSGAALGSSIFQFTPDT